jgi:hypothetical protein
MKKIRIFRKHYEKEKIEKESEKEDEKTQLTELSRSLTKK